MKTTLEIERAAALRRLKIDAVSDKKMDDKHSTPPPTRRQQSSKDIHDSVDEIATEQSVKRNAGNDQLNNRMFFRLFQLGNELQRQAVQQLGITTVQWAVLGALSQEKFASGIPFGQLGDYLVVTRQNLDGVIKRLERDGLVQRVTGNGDKRARLVQLTPRGRTYWKETLKRIYQFYDQASAHFSFDDRIAFVHYLNALQKDLTTIELPKASLPKRYMSSALTN
ncbi:MarR family transcriptional regulator [Mesorhizobium sp. YR577]|uniref:MarR family winged helix-turn-helix transcriptional regulator n=1 Tax=Mesorhizobium sp. YR577 TaxID=1884373 RepID=UPI0008DF3A6B|nr:MarR family transcriptional regulator [Mesorhizobium sp. YR577]SFU17129.1 DNA-binding transcriptional regulator, MarR family [Mesorhizobium sp. YR577]